VFDRFDLLGCCTILDVGCGPGDLWLENDDRIPAGWSVVLSDLSMGMLEKARCNLAGNSRRFCYRVIDAQAIPFPDESFDAVVANHMLFHVPSRIEVLYEMHRVLRPGGRLYAATNGLRHMRELRPLVARFCPDAEEPNVARLFGLENGAEQLSEHFADVRCHRQENALVVTEAEPLIAYVASMMCQGSWGQDVAALSRWAREQIAAEGAIYILKDSGMFVATKA
jgi:ubiquinone/menaquinone biosynthesis C-methylase UbiE